MTSRKPRSDEAAEKAESAESAEESKLLSSTALMASGTVVSRLSGFVRSTLLVAALGSQLHAELFTIANTIPNMLYILLAGGMFNAVLVPQLVRAMKNDEDLGEAYTNRIITLAALFLLTVTVLLVVFAPWVMAVYLDSSFGTPALAEHRESIIWFARYCLPQVFFYGMFVLLGQVLNARRRFGPMMWAPIANNVIAVLVLVTYLVTYGPASEIEQLGAFTRRQELLLGLGSTAGIAAQFLILVPYLKAAGFTFRPRFDFRHTGLGHTFKLGTWTLLFVIVNQIAYTVVVRLASGGTTQGVPGTGYTVYSNSFLIMMVPHSIITVSLATAVLPALSERAAESDLAGMARSLSRALRSALAVILPFALLLPLIAGDLAQVIWGYGAGRESYDLFVPTLALFSPGLLFFTVHYLMLRGFYALERTRTVFWVQCVIAVTNIAVAVTLVRHTTPEQTAPALVIAYAASYAVGSVLSYWLLSRTLGGLDSRQLVRFVVRVGLAAAVSTTVAFGVAWVLHHEIGDDTSVVVAALVALAITTVDIVIFLLLARLFRVSEVTVVIDLIARRLPSRTRQ